MLVEVEDAVLSDESEAPSSVSEPLFVLEALSGVELLLVSATLDEVPALELEALWEELADVPVSGSGAVP